MLALGALSSCAAATPPEHDRFSRIDAYLSQFSISNLPPLSVKFKNSEGAVELHGEASKFVRPRDDKLMQKNGAPPEVRWDLADAKATLLFLDLDAGIQPDSDAKSGTYGPFVHSMWVDCVSSPQGTLTPNCREVVKWKAPGNTAVKHNRYTFILFKQATTSPLVVDTKIDPGFKWTTQYSIAKLQRDNPGLTAVAYNLMLVNGDGKPTKKARKGRRLGRRLVGDWITCNETAPRDSSSGLQRCGVASHSV